MAAYGICSRRILKHKKIWTNYQWKSSGTWFIMQSFANSHVRAPVRKCWTTRRMNEHRSYNNNNTKFVYQFPSMDTPNAWQLKIGYTNHFNTIRSFCSFSLFFILFIFHLLCAHMDCIHSISYSFHSCLFISFVCKSYGKSWHFIAENTHES